MRVSILNIDQILAELYQNKRVQFWVQSSWSLMRMRQSKILYYLQQKLAQNLAKL